MSSKSTLPQRHLLLGTIFPRFSFLFYAFIFFLSFSLEFEVHFRCPETEMLKESETNLFNHSDSYIRFCEFLPLNFVTSCTTSLIPWKPVYVPELNCRRY